MQEKTNSTFQLTFSSNVLTVRVSVFTKTVTWWYRNPENDQSIYPTEKTKLLIFLLTNPNIACMFPNTANFRENLSDHSF